MKLTFAHEVWLTKVKNRHGYVLLLLHDESDILKINQDVQVIRTGTSPVLSVSFMGVGQSYKRSGITRVAKLWPN